MNKVPVRNTSTVRNFGDAILLRVFLTAAPIVFTFYEFSGRFPKFIFISFHFCHLQAIILVVHIMSVNRYFIGMFLRWNYSNLKEKRSTKFTKSEPF